MKITIKEGKKKLIIPIPNWLLFSSLSARILKINLKSEGDDGDPIRLDLTPRQMRKIRKCIRKMKKIHKDWYLVDMLDGEDTVKIRM